MDENEIIEATSLETSVVVDTAPIDYRIIAELMGLTSVALHDPTSFLAAYIEQCRTWIMQQEAYVSVLINASNSHIKALPTIKEVPPPTTFETIMSGVSATIEGVVTPIVNGATDLLTGVGTGLGNAFGGLFSGIGGSFGSLIGFIAVAGIALIATPKIYKMVKENSKSSSATNEGAPTASDTLSPE